ncbi:MAG: DUF1552 domain-containing protein [Armatimonadota bacterium]
MMIRCSQPLPRRTVLRAAGVTLALPLLDAMLPNEAFGNPSTFKPLAKSGLKPTPRAIFCYVPNGVNILEWVPKSVGKGVVLGGTLKGLASLRDHVTVLSGLGHIKTTGGHSGADTWLTGADLKAVPGKDYANSISADQVIAGKIGAATRFPSIEIGDMSGTGSALHSHTLAFDRNGTPLPTENSPRRLFERLFVPDDATSRALTLQRYAEKKSILDDVLADAKRLEGKLGKADRDKLAQYLQAVRETEARLARQVAWVDVPKPKVITDGLQLANQPGNAHDRPMWLDVMLELSYLAFVTDTTRVITFEWSREAGGYGGGGENHHELSHHGGDPGMLAKLAQIDAFHIAKLARFLEFLRATEEGGKTMLDHTMVMYGSGMNSGEKGDHSPKNLPLVLAGGSAWGLKHGQHIAHDVTKHPPLTNVLTTVIQKMGVEVETFGDATGSLSSLT